MTEEVEIWNPCPGYERYYDISNMGNLRSFHTKGTGSNLRIEPYMMTPSIEVYVYFMMSKGIGVQKLRPAHILVAQAFVENKDPKRLTWVHHKDEDKHNPRWDNLEWVTPGKNQEYAYQSGARQRPNGTRNGRSKMSEDQVMYIFNSKDTIYKLSSELGLNHTAVADIRSGKRWGYLTGKEYKRKGYTMLTDQDIMNIFNSEEEQITLAAKYKVSQSRISAIKTGRSYSHLTKVKFNGTREYVYHGIKTTVGAK